MKEDKVLALSKREEIITKWNKLMRDFIIYQIIISHKVKIF